RMCHVSHTRCLPCRAGRSQFISVPYYDNIPLPDRKAAGPPLPLLPLPCKFGICGRKARPHLCAFTKMRFYVLSTRFLAKKRLHAPVNSGMLYPNGASWIQGFSGCLHSRGCGPHVPFYVLLFSSFTFLSFTLPARTGTKRRPNLHGPPFIIFPAA